MASFFKGWTYRRFSVLATRIFLLLIIFQIPLFRKEAQMTRSEFYFSLIDDFVVSFAVFKRIEAVIRQYFYSHSSLDEDSFGCYRWNLFYTVSKRVAIKALRIQWIQCRSGMCTTPIQVTASQLVANHVFPQPVVKALLYPGALLNGIYTNMTFPSWDNLLHIYNLTNINNASAVVDLQRLEVLAGSYFAVAGGIIGILNPGRMSMFGTLLVVWGLVKEGILGKPVTTDPEKTVYVYPTMLIALICAVCSVKSNARKATRISNAQPIAKPLKSSTKSKLK